MKKSIVPKSSILFSLLAFTASSHAAVLVTDGRVLGASTSNVSANITTGSAGGPTSGNVTLSNDSSGNLIYSPNTTATNNDFFVTFNGLGLDTSIIKYAQINFLTTSAGAVTGTSEIFYTDGNSAIGGTTNSGHTFGTPAITTGGPFSVVLDLTSSPAGKEFGPGTSNTVRFDLFQAAANKGETFTISSVRFGPDLVPEPSSALLIIGSMLPFFIRRKR